MSSRVGEDKDESRSWSWLHGVWNSVFKSTVAVLLACDIGLCTGEMPAHN